MAIRPDWLQNPLERLESSRDDALGYQGGGGSNYGSPPYKESALKSALRLLAAGARGASYGMQAPDGFGAFGGSFGREYAYKTASERAAQDYALKQQENQRRQEDSEWNRKMDEARLKQMEKPEPPPKPEKHVPTMAEKRAEAEAMLGRPLTDDEARKLAGVHFNPPKPPVAAKGAKPPTYKPPKPPPRTGDAYDRKTGMKFNAQDEADILGIQKATPADIPDLMGVISNPRNSSPVRAAASKRLKELGAQ